MVNTNLKLVEKTGMDKTKALESALSQIERAFGKGSVMRLGQSGVVAEIESIPSGSLGLDIALGIGGLPKGRVVEIYGPESSGKTTLALHVLAEAQRLGGICAFIDAEHAMDPIYARKLGVDIETTHHSGERMKYVASTFCPEERNELENHSDMVAGAVELWSLKEAYGKALGVGIDIMPRRCRFTLTGPSAPQLVEEAVRRLHGLVWRFNLSSPREDLRLAVAISAESEAHIPMQVYWIDTFGPLTEWPAQ